MVNRLDISYMCGHSVGVLRCACSAIHFVYMITSPIFGMQFKGVN